MIIKKSGLIPNQVCWKVYSFGSNVYFFHISKDGQHNSGTVYKLQTDQAGNPIGMEQMANKAFLDLLVDRNNSLEEIEITPHNFDTYKKLLVSSVKLVEQELVNAIATSDFVESQMKKLISDWCKEYEPITEFLSKLNDPKYVMQ